MARVLVIGGGFGGLVTAEEILSNADARGHQVTVVSPRPIFTFYPGLVQLAFGECTAEDITFDLGERLREIGARYVEGELVRIDHEQRKAEIAGPDLHGDLAYDVLVLAAGRRLATEKIPGFFEYSHHLLGTKAAQKFSEAVRSFEKGTMIVGMCPDGRLPVPVCETAFALARRFEPQVRSGDVRIKIVFPGSLSEAFGGASIHKELESAFARHGISALYDIPVNDVNDGEILSSEGHRIAFDLLMLVPPFRGQSFLKRLGITDEHDFVRVDRSMRVLETQGIYAVGDVVAFDGPKFAHMAVRQAAVAAENIVSELGGRQPAAVYDHEIATIIDAGGPDSIYLHYGIWDDEVIRLKKGRLWGWAKELHDARWRRVHGPRNN